MATSLKNQFTAVLEEVSGKLNEDNIRQLVNLVESIPASVRDDIISSMDLFTQLQELECLNENNVNNLITWLEELRLYEASEPLIKYRDEHLQHTDEEREKCNDHTEEILQLFCITCDTKICCKCHTCSHKKIFGCDVVEVACVTAEIESRKKTFKEHLTSLRENTVRTKTLWSEKETSILVRYEQILNRIREDETATCKEIIKNEEKLLQILDEKEKYYLDEIALEQRNIDDIVAAIKNMRDTCISLEGEAVTQLRKIRASRKKAGNFKRALEQLETDLKNKYSGVSYKGQDDECMFGELKVNTLVGGVTVNKAQIVNLYDDRQTGGVVRLVCIDNTDPKKEHWRYEVTSDKNDFPVVMSHLSLVCHIDDYDETPSDLMTLISQLRNEIDHVLFAVGKRVSVIRSELEAGELYKTLDLHDIEDAAWITSICAHYGSYGTKAKFIISVSNNTFIREYDISGDPLRIIDTKDWISSIRGVAYIDNSVAIIGQGRNESILVTCNGVAEQTGSLVPPSSPRKYFPVCLIWTGATWVVLYVSEESVKDWKVLQYDKKGTFKAVCSTGTSHDDSDLPLSITRWQNTGYINFANSTIGVFTH